MFLQFEHRSCYLERVCMWGFHFKPEASPGTLQPSIVSLRVTTTPSIFSPTLSSQALFFEIFLTLLL